MFYKMALVEAHGHGVWCYDHLENIAQDPNLTIECLQRTFKKVEANLGRLPDHLFIQMDNCWRENKNNALVHWLVIHTDLATPVTPKPHTTSLSTPQVSLVDRGLFPGGIEMCFLPKGHTHNEMDQHASRISVGVRKRDVFNRDQLVERVQSAFRGLETERISLVANTKQWLNKGKTEATVDFRGKGAKAARQQLFSNTAEQQQDSSKQQRPTTTNHSNEPRYLQLPM